MWLPDEVWAIRQIWLERRGDDWEPVEAAAIAMMEQRRKTKKLDVRMIGFIIGIFLGYLTLILMLIITLAFSLFFPAWLFFGISFVVFIVSFRVAIVRS